MAADLTLHDDSASRISFSGKGGATPLSDPRALLRRLRPREGRPLPEAVVIGPDGARTGMTASARTPVLPEAVPVGPLSALLRRSIFARRLTLSTRCCLYIGPIKGGRREKAVFG